MQPLCTQLAWPGYATSELLCFTLQARDAHATASGTRWRLYHRRCSLLQEASMSRCPKQCSTRELCTTLAETVMHVKQSDVSIAVGALLCCALALAEYDAGWKPKVR
jgi:hypothetical protein